MVVVVVVVISSSSTMTVVCESARRIALFFALFAHQFRLRACERIVIDVGVTSLACVLTFKVR